jgi:hypothetical protein
MAAGNEDDILRDQLLVEVEAAQQFGVVAYEDQTHGVADAFDDGICRQLRRQAYDPDSLHRVGRRAIEGGADRGGDPHRQISGGREGLALATTSAAGQVTRAASVYVPPVSTPRASSFAAAGLFMPEK